jgi:Rab-GTPase-TBC domain
MFGVDEPA